MEILKRLFIKIPLHLLTFILATSLIPFIIYYIITGRGIMNMLEDLEDLMKWIDNI